MNPPDPAPANPAPARPAANPNPPRGPADWPDFDPNAGDEKTYAAEQRKIQFGIAKLARESPLATDDHLERHLHEALIAESSASVQRISDAAKWIEGAAAGLAGLYATALGITFAIASNPLPMRGFIAPLFFGLSIACAAVYLAFLGRGDAPGRPDYAPGPPARNWEKTNYFNRFAKATAYNRAGWLRAAVLALFFGVMAMPLPYLNFSALAGTRVTESAPAATLPSPPEGNEEAEALWYRATLDQVKEGGSKTEQVIWLDEKKPTWLPFDWVLGAVLLVAWVLVSVALNWWAGRSRVIDP